MIATATMLVLQGVLVTYANGVQIGREAFHDDGATLTSEVVLGAQSSTVKVTRAPRHVAWSSGEKKSESDVPAGTIVLENGSWQQYALAAEWFPSASEKPLAVKVLLPGPGLTLDGTLSVKRAPDGVRTVEVELKGLRVSVEVGTDGRARRASVPQQHLEARPESGPPATVIEEPFSSVSNGVKLAGVLWRPRAAKGKVPVALIVHGSGSHDRNGPLDVYRALAMALAERGVATVRYDKRGVGESGKNFDFAKVTLEDFVGDAAEMARALRKDARFSSVALIGHSEGALIGTLVAPRVPLDHLVLVSGAGRPLHAVLHEQLARTLSPADLAESDRIVAALRAGKPIGKVPTSLAALFPDAVLPFLRSELDLDPAALLKLVKAPTAIIQGETDMQISVADAHALAAARPDAKLILIPRANHLLKDEAARAMPQSSYSDPTRPFAPGLVDAIATAAR